MTERAKVVLEWERRWNDAEGGRVDVAELARLFGVSRQTAYAWIRATSRRATMWRPWKWDRAPPRAFLRCVDERHIWRASKVQLYR